MRTGRRSGLRITCAIILGCMAIAMLAPAAEAYSGGIAAAYADTWVYSYNTGSSRHYINATSYGEPNDCTNYVSQAIYAGGLAQIFTGYGGDMDAWWWDSPEYADSWIRAMVSPSTPPTGANSGLINHAYRYIGTRFQPQASTAGLRVGDFYSMDLVGPNYRDVATHSRIVVSIDHEGGLSTDQHTAPLKHVPYAYNWDPNKSAVWKIDIL
jgi:putative amidase-like protein